jgi:hypothetical protein
MRMVVLETTPMRFLPAVCQGTSIGRSFQPASQMTIDFIRNTELSEDQTRRRYSLTQQMNQLQSARNQHADDEVNAVIRNYELAWRMQAQAPEILDLSKESKPLQRCTASGKRKPMSSVSNA